MKTIRPYLLMLACLAVTVHVAAQESVGRIDSVDGYAQIDAFGTGRFIEARDGDSLYEATVIRTEYDGWVRITVDGESYAIAQNSQTRISSYLAERRRAAGSGFLQRLIRGIADALAPPEEQEQALGTRASDQAGSTTSMFVLDVDPYEAYEWGVEALDEGRFAEAAEHFRSFDPPMDPDFPLDEYFVLTTYALLGMGDFSEAIRTAFDAHGTDPDPAEVGRLNERLQLLVAIAAYYSDDDTLAREASGRYVDEVGIANADPQGIAIAILLEEDRTRARRLERDARSAHPNTDWNQLLERES